MKVFVTFLLLLMQCGLYRAQKQSSNEVENGFNMAETHGQRAEAGKGELTPQSDIVEELRILRDMVVEQGTWLRYLMARVTATDVLVEGLQQEHAVMKARMTAAESLVEELQMEKDAQAIELGALQQRLTAVQERLTANEHNVEELQKQQEGQNVVVEELQNINTALSVGDLRMRLVKNENPMVFAGDRPPTPEDYIEDNVTNGAVLQLEAGDVVYVQLSGSVWDDQYHRTTFSGFLLFSL